MSKKLLLTATVVVAGTALLIYKHNKDNKEIDKAWTSLIDLKSRIPAKINKIDPENKLNIEWCDYDYVANITTFSLYDLDGMENFSFSDQTKLVSLINWLIEISRINNEILDFASIGDYDVYRKTLKKYAKTILTYKEYVDNYPV